MKINRLVILFGVLVFCGDQVAVAQSSPKPSTTVRHSLATNRLMPQTQHPQLQHPYIQHAPVQHPHLHGCGCEAPPKCCDSCGHGYHDRLADLFSSFHGSLHNLFHGNHCGCDAKCGCEPKCGHQPKCGCEPKCGHEPNCGCGPKHFWQPKCGCEPACGMPSKGMPRIFPPVDQNDPFIDDAPVNRDVPVPPRSLNVPSNLSTPRDIHLPSRTILNRPANNDRTLSPGYTTSRPTTATAASPLKKANNTPALLRPVSAIESSSVKPTAKANIGTGCCAKPAGDETLNLFNLDK